MDTDGPKDFFISYTHADQRWAEWLAWHLEDSGYRTVLQAWDFLAGGNFVLNMDAAARQATRTIAVFSPDYFASKFTRAEWAAAFRHDPTGEQGLLLPVRVRPCDVEGLLGQIVYLDLVDQDEATARATLLQGVKHERRKPTSPPVFPSTLHPPQSSEHPSFPGALPAIWNIPYPRNPYFTGREELLSQLPPRCGQDRRSASPNHRRSVAWEASARRRSRWNMPIATTRTMKRCSGPVPTHRRRSSPDLWSSRPCYSFRYKRSTIN